MKIIFVSIWLLGSIALFTPAVFSQGQRPQGHHQDGNAGGHERGVDSTMYKGGRQRGNADTTKFRGGNGPGEMKPDYSKLKTELGLTDIQVDSLKALDQKYRIKEQAVRSNKSLNEEDKKVLMRDLRTEKEASLKKILTNEQYTKFKANKGHGRLHHKRDYDKLKTDLALSDKQVESLKKLDQQYRAKAVAVKNDTSLSEESKKSSMKSLRIEKHAEVKKVFTAEQYAKFQANRQAGKKGNCSGRKG